MAERARTLRQRLSKKAIDKKSTIQEETKDFCQCRHNIRCMQPLARRNGKEQCTHKQTKYHKHSQCHKHQSLRTTQQTPGKRETQPASRQETSAFRLCKDNRQA